MIWQTLPGVILDRRTPALAWILLVLAADQDKLTVTSIGDGQHSEHSAHYRGEAVDVRSQDLAIIYEKRARVMRLRQSLGPRFTVLLEPYDIPGSAAAEHIHIQLSIGRVFTPQSLTIEVDQSWNWTRPPAPPLRSA